MLPHSVWISCKTTMEDLEKLRQEKEISFDEKSKIRYKCEICDKEFKNNGILKNHFDIVHGFVKGIQCNICQKRFMFQSQLTSHEKISHENKKDHNC